MNKEPTEIISYTLHKFEGLKNAVKLPQNRRGFLATGAGFFSASDVEGNCFPALARLLIFPYFPPFKPVNGLNYNCQFAVMSRSHLHLFLAVSDSRLLRLRQGRNKPKCRGAATLLFLNRRLVKLRKYK